MHECCETESDSNGHNQHNKHMPNLGMRAMSSCIQVAPPPVAACLRNSNACTAHAAAHVAYCCMHACVRFGMKTSTIAIVREPRSPPHG